MTLQVERWVHVAASLRRGHGALADAIVVPRRVSALAIGREDPALARLEDALPSVWLPWPIAEAMVFGGVAVLLAGVGLLGGGFLGPGLLTVGIGAASGAVGAKGLRP